MRTLNRAASEAMLSVDGVRACTDVTGFGLIGHACAMAAASQVTLVFTAASVPLLEGAYALVGRNKTGGGNTNREHFSQWVRVNGGVDRALVDLCYDPQTSGGLLVAVDAYKADVLAAACERNGVTAVAIGQAQPVQDVRVILN
jgi:selenide,water dikinase